MSRLSSAVLFLLASPTHALGLNKDDVHTLQTDAPLQPTHVASSARTTFYYYSELKTWFEARDFCETNHASLASIRSADESRLLAQAMSGGVAGHGTWLGGTALDTEDPNFRSPRAAQIAPARNRQQSTDLSNWRWYPNDGASTGGLSASGVYLNWNNNEPNNGGNPTTPGREFCMLTWGPREGHPHWNANHAYKWNDWHCGNRETFICEAPPLPTCQTSYTMTTNNQALCVAPHGGRVVYTAEACGTNQIRYTAAQAMDIRPGLNAAACNWQASSYSGSSLSLYFGTCGVAPTVNGGDTLPTACIPAPPSPPPSPPPLPRCEAYVSMTTTDPSLCVPATGGLVEYTTSMCGATASDPLAQSIEYVHARAIDQRPGVIGACAWNAAAYSGDGLARFFGGCGTAPNTNGGNQVCKRLPDSALTDAYPMLYDYMLAHAHAHATCTCLHMHMPHAHAHAHAHANTQIASKPMHSF